MKKTENEYIHEKVPFTCNIQLTDRSINDICELQHVAAEGRGPSGRPLGGFNRYYSVVYSYYRIWNRLSKTTTVSYEKNGRVVQTHEYTYNGKNYKVSTDKSGSSEKGRTFTTAYRYPCDFPDDDVLRSMTTDNRIGDVVDQTLSSGGNELKHIRTLYGLATDGYGTRRYYPTEVYTSMNGNALERRLVYGDYDNLLNPRIFVKDGADKRAWLWSYDSSYPVAEVQGMTYGELSDALAGGVLGPLARRKDPQPSDLQAVSDKLMSAGRPLLMTGYLYQPGAGISYMVSPNGCKTSYAYDDHNRFSASYDNDGKLTASCEYAYGSEDNHVQTETMLTGDGGSRITSLQYYDGLGRPVQASTNGTGGNGHYVSTVQEYRGLDNIGRQWLPVVDGATPRQVWNAGNAGDELATLSCSTYGGDNNAYSDNTYDALGRVVSTATPGEAWHAAGKAVTKEYLTNTDNDVKLYTAPMDGKNHLVKSGYYESCQLFGERTTDEDGHSLTIFTDKFGRKVLERRNSDEGNNDTYFVYNDLGQLRFVLSPEYQNHGFKAIFGYEYRYDKRGNIVKKILPQCEYIQYWYDTADRLTFMQDANLRSKNKYRFMLYDRLGRLCVQGLCDDFDRSVNVSDVNLSVEYKQGAEGLCNTGYVLSRSFTLKNASLEKACYYDNYDFLSGSRKAEFAKVAPTQSGYSSVNVIGMQTGTLLYASDDQYLYETKVYDRKGREVESRSTTASGSVEDVKSEYTFTDNIAKQTSSISKDGSVVVSSVTTNEYNSHNNKVASTNIVINDGTQQKACDFRYDYDDLGRLKATYRPYKSGDVSRVYNLHGWTTSISTPTFTEKLYYADDISYGNHYYNGNICAQRWTNGNYSPSRWYKFSYDKLNRLTDAEYSENDSQEGCQNYYDESVLKYDANGNIERLQRRGRKQNGHVGKIDNLHIYHNGNQLDWVKDDADKIYYAGIFNFNGDDKNEAHYKYNDSGSLTEDTGRGITNIEYDDFNNPKRIQFSNGNVTRYVYSAEGEKLRMVHYTAAPNISVAAGQTHELSKGEILSVDSTDYIGSLIMKNGTPDIYLFAGGYYKFISGTGIPSRTGGEGGSCYFYNYDHLGNVREVVNEEGKLEQVNNYYPFGAPFSDNAISMKDPGFQPYKYTGKELDLTHGLNTYDHGARQNYSILGVWDRVDPLTEKYYNVSPYAVCGDDPINYKDYSGGDYNVYDDPDNQDGIIVSAKLYCSNTDEKSALKAANFWNEQSYKYTYNGQYVIFSISVIVIEPQEIAKELGKENITDKQAVDYAFSQDKSGEANIYRTVPRKNLSFNDDYMNINGETEQSYIRIASDCANTDTGSHEVGHALGMMHTFSGIMTPASSDPNRTYHSVLQNIQDCIENARGKRKSGATGIGHYYNFYFYSHNVL